MPIDRWCEGCQEFHSELTADELMETLKYASVGMLIVWLYNRRRPRLEASPGLDSIRSIRPSGPDTPRNDDHD